MADAWPAPRLWSATDLIAMLTDDGSFTVWDDDLVPTDPLRFTDVRPCSPRDMGAERIDPARVIAALEGAALPEHVQRAEHLHDRGMVDGSVGAAAKRGS